MTDTTASDFTRGATCLMKLQRDFPLLWARSVTADTRERLGQSVDPLDAECDAVLREVWDARRNAAEAVA